MALYRYFGGGQTSIGDRGFDFVGQQAEFDDKLYREVVAGGGVFIPEAEFEKLDIRQDEITHMQWHPDSRPAAELVEKIERAREIFREIYGQVRSGTFVE